MKSLAAISPLVATPARERQRPFATLRRDAARYFALDSHSGDPSLIEKIRIFCDSPGFQAVAVYRFGVWVNRIRSDRSAIR